MLIVHRAPRADALADALAAVLADPLADPFAPELVSVPTRGVERWLGQRLAGVLGASGPGAGDGIAANIAFPFPGVLVGEVLARASGVDPATDPWRPERVVWPLMRVVDQAMGEAWIAPLARHIGHGSDPDRFPDRPARRFRTVRHLADLFDRYAVHRPDMLRAWHMGDDTDGNAPLTTDHAWQPELWRRLVRHLGDAGPAIRLPTACQALAQGRVDLPLPSRISLFGLTRLPASYLDVLEAVAHTRDVHLFVLHPSPALWEVVATDPPVPRTCARGDDPGHPRVAHPLLASWGRDAREMQHALLAAHPTVISHAAPEPAPTLLGRLQADIRHNRAPTATPPLMMGHTDLSVQVHSCHGRTRQVEVVRDAVLHVLAADPSLHPRDVVVMCPDIEEFAPLIHAVFDTADVDAADRPPDLRVRLADRSLRQTNPVAAVVAQVLEIAAARASRGQVLSLASAAPVRRRFGFSDDDLARISVWTRDAGVRWGFGPDDRAGYGLGHVDANTWRAGLDRLVMGVAAGEPGGVVGTVLPLDDVGSTDIDLVGRLAEMVQRLETVVHAMRAPRPLAQWLQCVADAADLLTDVAPGDAGHRHELDALLTEFADHDPDGHSPSISRAEFTDLVADRLRGQPTRANFRTGSLTVCTLVPMRSVPHRVVCVVGLDDGAFPRRATRDGDDILLACPRVGDHDTRGEDRQLLLDAVMAADDHLVLAYSGHDERTNAALPPAVPLMELLDVVDQCATTDTGEAARTRITRRHPLQPFDPAAFAADAPWSFDPAAYTGARALSTAAAVSAPFLEAPLPPLPPQPLALEALGRFLKDPVGAFLTTRLSLWLQDAKSDEADEVPLDLDHLQAWELRDRLLQAARDGVSAQQWQAAERARGLLPPGQLGDAHVAEAIRRVDALMAAAQAYIAPPARQVAVDVTQDGAQAVVGTVASVHGDTYVDLRPSRASHKRLLDAWLTVLALTASDPRTWWDAVIIGDAGAGKAPTAQRIEALPGSVEERQRRAVDQLVTLIDLYRRGMCAPLPLFALTSHALAVGDLDAAREAWEGSYRRTGEAVGPAVRQAFGTLGFDQLIALPAAADETGDGWDETTPSRAIRLARRVWGGVLHHQAGGR